MTAVDSAIARGLERADTIAQARARLSGAMRIIFDLGGLNAVRDVVKAEMERLPVNGNTGTWIG